MTDTVTGVPAGFDFTDPDLYVERVPVEEFAALRRVAKPFWNPQTLEASGFSDGGFWAISRHEDVKTISADRDRFSSEEKTAIIKYGGAMDDPGAMDVLRLLLINMDAPQHTKIRGIISRGCFTPRAIAKLEDILRERAVRIVAEAKAKGTGDFVEDVACELPLQAIADLVGFPQEDRKKVFDWSNQMIGMDDPDYTADPAVIAAELLGYAYEMGESRKACPMDDIATRLVQADVDGHSLSAEEFGYFVMILAVAGNETTRNAITHGMNGFFDHPEQWERYKAERPSTAADEIIRWATPVTAFQRTATEDVEVGGQLIKAGQRVGLFYGSANFDETVFEDPYTFDIGRDPNPHVAFGGGGAHYCIGANLAKMEIDLMFNAIADAVPDIERLAPARRLRSGWLNGVKELPVRYA